MRLLLLTVLLIGCKNGGGGDDGPCKDSTLVSVWALDSDTSSTLTFYADCSYAGSSCSSTGTYPNVTTPSGNVLIKIISTSGESGCLPLGETACSYSINGSSLVADCGGGDFLATKK